MAVVVRLNTTLLKRDEEKGASQDYATKEIKPLNLTEVAQSTRQLSQRPHPSRSGHGHAHPNVYG